MATAAVHTSTNAAIAAQSTANTYAPSIGNWITPQNAGHPEAAEILRQVEYYFSDENLPGDAYLLGFAGLEGTNPVNLGLIMNFKNMKRFRPKAAVREVLKASTLVEVVDNNHIRRRFPLTMRVTVTPRIDVNRYKHELARIQQPHLTKNMLKPTGFEPNATEGPIAPDQYEKDLEKYSPDESVITRLETAVNCFNANRKMHQHTRAIFEKLMIFGGFGCNTRMFQGGMDKKQMQQDSMDKEEIAQATAYYGVAEQVSDAFFKEWEESKKSSWVVDFEALAKGFLSSEFLADFEWYDAKHVATATQVLRNFYNYFTVHSVCPEYNDQLLAARRICDVAEQELPKLAIIDRSLPGAFNSACSTLFGGSYADVHISKQAKDDWGQGADNFGLDHDEAVNIFNAGLAAYGTDEQCSKASTVRFGNSGPKCISEEKVGLEIATIELPTDTAKETYDFLCKREGYKDYIHTMGKLICVRWDVPLVPPVDLPAELMKTKIDKNQKFKFLVEAETLKYCVPGMKMEAVVKELDLGIKWIDSIEVVHPTFYTWLPNEQVLRWKEPGPPKEWTQRQQAKEMGLVETGGGAAGDAAVGEGEARYDDEEAD